MDAQSYAAYETNASRSSIEPSVQDAREHDMVRHEAAESLGSIADEVALQTLRAFSADADIDPIVRESCQVAIDLTSHWQSANEL